MVALACAAYVDDFKGVSRFQVTPAGRTWTNSVNDSSTRRKEKRRTQKDGKRTRMSLLPWQLPEEPQARAASMFPVLHRFLFL